MNRNGIRWATGLVAVCTIMGMIGFVKSQSFPPPQQTLERIAAFVTGTFFTRFQFEIAGSDSSLGHTLFLSAKSEEVRKEGSDSGTAMEPETEAEAGIKSGQALPQDEAATTLTPTSNVPVTPVEAEAPATIRKVAFIYHSHNRESWLPELKGTSKDKPNEAFDAEINVSRLGARLQEKLEEKGIGAIHSDADYNSAVPSFNYNYSYKYSKTTVKEALAVHQELTYLFDIHRDSQRRTNTTITIDGIDYAKMYFIVGQGNPKWNENKAFAKQIHEAMEARLPGVSKGILTKGAKHGDGEYNQSLSSSSVLIEIGGVDNTLKESYRTIDVLASIVAELVMDAKQVDGPAAPARDAKVSAQSPADEIITTASVDPR
jgi:stage II sporulation protein P